MYKKNLNIKIKQIIIKMSKPHSTITKNLNYN